MRFLVGCCVLAFVTCEMGVLPDAPLASALDAVGGTPCNESDHYLYNCKTFIPANEPACTQKEQIPTQVTQGVLDELSVPANICTRNNCRNEGYKQYVSGAGSCVEQGSP